MSGSTRKEVSELNQEREAPESLWAVREELLTANGIVTHSGLQTISKCPIVFSKSREWFNPSTRTVRSFLELVCQSIVTQLFNSEENFMYNGKQAAIVSSASNKYLLQRMR